jgi:hypothetical protein
MAIFVGRKPKLVPIIIGNLAPVFPIRWVCIRGFLLLLRNIAKTCCMPRGIASFSGGTPSTSYLLVLFGFLIESSNLDIYIPPINNSLFLAKVKISFLPHIC